MPFSCSGLGVQHLQLHKLTIILLEQLCKLCLQFWGAQSIHTNSKDEAISLPTDDAAKLALRTQQIIAYESGVINHPDPFGGSETVEKMTEAIIKKTKNYN